MKNKYNFSQVAAVYCAELGIDASEMEQYLKGIFSDLPIDIYENNIKNKIKGNCNSRSEYFPDFYD